MHDLDEQDMQQHGNSELLDHTMRPCRFGRCTLSASSRPPCRRIGPTLLLSRGPPMLVFLTVGAETSQPSRRPLDSSSSGALVLGDPTAERVGSDELLHLRLQGLRKVGHPGVGVVLSGAGKIVGTPGAPSPGGACAAFARPVPSWAHRPATMPLDAVVR